MILAGPVGARNWLTISVACLRQADSTIVPEPTPEDVIAGAAIPEHPNAYVLGCYDTRITLYSQQVRALELAYALLERHHVTANTHVAIIGGGAGGMTLAAALALQGVGAVHLFERGNNLMPLQSNATRRRLDPHIYNWPDPGADNEEAELPILDWRSGPAVEVREALVQGFGAIRLATGERLVVHCASKVTGVEPDESTYQLRYEVADGVGGLRRDGLRVDLIVIAVGFGLEPTWPIPGIRAESYWRDAGVPGGDVAGHAHLAVAVSGNGDGGLIDLVAASSRDFSHGAMIRMIIARPGVDRLYAPLAAIDAQARAEDNAGRGFDFVTAYDAQIGPIADALGLTAETARRLMPGVRIHLQTREPELMSARTATLNRLAVYLVRRACERTPGLSFEHIVCADVTLLAPDAGPEAAAFILDCGGNQISVDTLVVRRGPGREAARLPFADLLQNYPNAHEAWTRRFPSAAIAPSLSDEARRHFARQAREQHLPCPIHRRTAEAAGAASRIKVAIRDGRARWTGDVALTSAAIIWDGRSTELTIVGAPEEFGSLAYALTRMALHSPGCTMYSDVVRWGPFLERLTVDSMHAEDLELPALLPIGGSSDLHPELYTFEEMACRLGAALDRRVLAFIDDHLTGFFERSADPGHAVDLEPATDVRDAMRETWAGWKAAFGADDDLLSRFLRLLVCAVDGDATTSEARTLVGPRRRKFLIRATAAALAVAAGWIGTSPQSNEPGNLKSQPMPSDAGVARTGHVCAAERITGRSTANEAAGFLWGTDFVVLPMLTSPVSVALRAEERLDTMDDDEPTLATTNGQPSLMLSLDPGFKRAVATSVFEVARFLARADADHNARNAGTIERGEDALDSDMEVAA